jgi:hypothetical protein
MPATLTRTRPQREVEIIKFAQMCAFMTVVDVIATYAAEADPHQMIREAIVKPGDWVGHDHGGLRSGDCGYDGKALFEKWHEGLYTLCSRMGTCAACDGRPMAVGVCAACGGTGCAGLRNLPAEFQKWITEIANPTAKMTADVFFQNRGMGGVRITAQWLTEFKRIIESLPGLTVKDAEDVCVMLRRAIDYGMEKSKDDPLLPAAMQEGFTCVQPLDTDYALPFGGGFND